MVTPQNTPSSSFNPLKLLALFLLLPAIFFCGATRAIPAFYNAYLSTFDYSGIGEKESIGLKNYDLMVNDDEDLQPALIFTGRLTAIKVAILAVVPVLVGLMIGVQGRIARWINRVLLAIIAVGIIPPVLTILWRSFWSPFWNPRKGIEGLYSDPPDWIFIGSRTGAPNNLSLFHMMLFLGVALAVGSVIYIAVARGLRFGRDAAVRAGVAVWIILLLWGVLITSDTFIPSYLITRGGPANSTYTLPMLFYRYFAQFFQLGYASALAMPGIIAAAIAGIGIWAVMTFFNLRMRFISSEPLAFSNSLWGVGSIPLVLLLGFPLLGLIGWGVWYIWSNEVVAEARELVDWPQTLRNSFVVPWLTIWFIQIPITYLVGITLGFVRPLGRIGSSLLFLPFLLFAIIPDDLLSVSWFDALREAGYMNTDSARTLPWYIGIISLIVFKLFFDGAHDRYQEVRAAGKDAGKAFVEDVLLPSLLIVVLVGAVLSFISAQELFWPLFSMNSQDQWPATIVALQIQGAYSSEIGLPAAVPLLYLGILALIFVPVFVLLHLVVLDRLALVAGPTEPPNVPVIHTVVSTIVEPEPVVDTAPPLEEDTTTELEA